MNPLVSLSRRTGVTTAACAAILLGAWAPAALAARPPDPLTIRGGPAGLQLELPREPIPPVGGSRYRLRLESTTDLRTWEPAGELSVGDSGRPAASAGWTSPHRFFRLAPEIEVTGDAADGADLFGYQRIFREELRAVGYLTPAEFATAHQPPANRPDRIAFDPRTARYWDAFAADPRELNQGKKYGDPGWRSWDFRLSDAELVLFLRNGFVVSPRLGSVRAPGGTGAGYQSRSTFAELYYRVFNDDLPVFISADAALHAWHYSYARLLSELEQTHLASLLEQILGNMAARLAETPARVRAGPLRDHLVDADYFLTVARSLLAGTPVAPVLGANPDVAKTLEAIAGLQPYLTPPGFPMFGGARPIDFSQFKPRGYYERSPDLERYFRAYQWTSRADLRIADPDQPEQSRRELGTAIVLSLLLRDSAARQWQALDQVIRLFVGRTDALNFAQLDPLLEAAGITSLDAITRSEQIADLQRRLLQGDLGIQLIPGDVHFTPFGLEQAQLPRAFVLTGQRFVPDGWAMAQVTFDRVEWFEDIPGATYFRKVLRRVPAVPDIAYAVLGNRPAGWYLGERMTARRRDGDFRDGFPYAHHLTALARTFDRLGPEAWTDTLYARWLWVLRALSPAELDPRLPEAMRTRAWAMHSLNTQLASYTELKHDTLLYGKQPYAANIICEYPAGFVEPLPEFWQRLERLALAAADGLASVPVPTGILIVPSGSQSSGPQVPTVDRRARHVARITFCRNFALRMSQLGALAQKELRQEPFTDTDLGFIRGLMNDRTMSGYGGATYDGWYPQLFYEDFTLIGIITVDENGSNQPDRLVADLFTAPPDQVDPLGGVLHAATGDVDLLLMAVDNGPDRMVYAGPVLSYFEFLEPGPALRRLTDRDWQQRLDTGSPRRPAWTDGHIAPAR